MTAITMIRVATPSMMPRKENPAITEIKASLRRALKYRQATMRSNAENEPAEVSDLSGADESLIDL